MPAFETSSLADSGLSDSSVGKQTKNSQTYKIAFFITLPVFTAYACCFSLQKSLGYVFGLKDGVSGDTLSLLFGFAVSSVYLFNLLFRVLGHNLVFGFLAPRNRVIAALVSCSLGMALLGILSMQKKPPHVAWVFVCYAFIGVCEGTYCPNMFTVVHNLGETRFWVVISIPFGVGFITIGAFLLMSLGVPFQFFYFFSSGLGMVSLITYLFTIYRASKDDCADEAEFRLKDFGKELKKIKEWFPKIWDYCFVFVINMACLAMFNPGCILYAYGSRVSFRLFDFTVDHDAFICLYNVGGVLGDFFGRRVMDKKRLINPFWYFILLIISFGINMSLIPEIAPIAAFGFMFANGGLYQQTSKKISQEFPDHYHMTANSTWLFIGDIGSTGGSNLIQFVRPYIDCLKSLSF